MVDIITFINERKVQIEIIIEPSAESIDLPVGKTASFEISRDAVDSNDPLEIVFKDEMVKVYEQRQARMKMFIDGELQFYNE